MVREIESLFRSALTQVLGDQGREVDPLIRPASDEQFGDYQSNVAMSLAKALGRKPRDLAGQIAAALGDIAAEVCEPPEIAGPGFINIRLRPQWLAAALEAVPLADDDARLGLEPALHPDTVVVDYSSPNIAKQMHVGHLRSTIIGDSIARVLEFEGHKVIRQNHVGDWGTQFGMLIAHVKEEMPGALDRPAEVHLEDLESFYRQASARAEADPGFRDRARAEVVALHRHEPSTLRAWQYIVEESRRHYLPIYRRLGVGLTRQDERGESFYADRLESVVADLEARYGAGRSPRMSVTESDGALCVFHRDEFGQSLFKNPRGEAFPLMIRKSDGAFLYATTDLAAVQFRIREMHVDRIIYVTDARQIRHFEMIFATARLAGWTRPARWTGEVRLEHVTFGSILGEDRKPLKTRGGESVKLADLLEEAVNRAERLVRASEANPEKKRGFTEEEIRGVAEAVGIGAVKYADLSQNRQVDYVFSWDKMLALEGNTAPYLMYAYARIRSIYRKGAEGVGRSGPGRVVLTGPAERTLARQILRFPETLEVVASALKINALTDYLYELAGAFMKFYETCPVLKADDAVQRGSRLRLCELTGRTLRIGLDLLGIRVVERM